MRLGACRLRGVRDAIAETQVPSRARVTVVALFNGRRFRILTVVDCHSCEALAIVPRVSFPAFGVVEVLDRLKRERGAPQTIRCDKS